MNSFDVWYVPTVKGEHLLKDEAYVRKAGISHEAAMEYVHTELMDEPAPDRAELWNLRIVPHGSSEDVAKAGCYDVEVSEEFFERFMDLKRRIQNLASFFQNTGMQLSVSDYESYLAMSESISNEFAQLTEDGLARLAPQRYSDESLKDDIRKGASLEMIYQAGGVTMERLIQLESEVAREVVGQGPLDFV